MLALSPSEAWGGGAGDAVGTASLLQGGAMLERLSSQRVTMITGSGLSPLAWTDPDDKPCRAGANDYAAHLADVTSGTCSVHREVTGSGTGQELSPASLVYAGGRWQEMSRPTPTV